MRKRYQALAAAAAILSAATMLAGQDRAKSSRLEFRRITEQGIARTGTAIPAEAVRVFVYEGEPRAGRVTRDHIAIDYHGLSGVLFDRKTGKPLRRFTIADGWPDRRPEGLPSPTTKHSPPYMVGPGVLLVYRSHDSHAPRYAVAASAEFGQLTWKAMQPAGFLGSLRRRVGNDYKKMRQTFGSWSSILRVLNAESFLAAESADGRTVRYTTEDGLASNIVTHLAVAEGKLWAACVDIYDTEKKQWGPGGLCLFDPKTGRWRRIEKIAGRGVRWVTLLQTAGGALWVGFRTGSGIAGDTVAYGMGLYPGDYRPQAKEIVLARLAGGEWTTFVRKPLSGGRTTQKAPTERPRRLALIGGEVFLFSQTYSRAGGNWDVRLDGHISLLSPAEGKWRTFDIDKDFGAYRLSRMLAEDGELLAFTGRGAHRWSGGEGKWVFLDPQSPIVNPILSAAAVVGEELWLGYNVQSYGLGILGRQGISRFNEKSLAWSYTSPEEIGTPIGVRGIVPMPDGDVWVLFGRREYWGAMRSPRALARPNVPKGVGRFRKGKWELPVKLEGVPDSIERQRKGREGIQKWTQPAPIQRIAGAGGRLFVANAAGVYVGPGKWKQILKGPSRMSWRFALSIKPSGDGKYLLIMREDEETRGAPRPKLQRGRYDPATGKLTLSTIDWPAHYDGQALYEAGHLLSYYPRSDWRGPWTELPTRKQGRWAAGPLDGEHHAIVATPWAVWIASRGQLIRLDRKHLREWLGSGRG